MTQKSGFIGDLQTTFGGLLRIADCAVILLAAVIAQQIRFGELRIDSIDMVAVGLAVFFMINFAQITGIYRIEKMSHFATQVGKITLTWAAVLAVLATLAFMTKTSAHYSRLWVGTWSVFCFVGLMTVHAFAHFRVLLWSRAGRLDSRLLILGTKEIAERWIKYLDDLKERDFKLLGVVLDTSSSTPDKVAGCQVIGTFDSLASIIDGHQPDEILIALPWDDEGRIRDIVDELGNYPISARLVPEHVPEFFSPTGIRLIGGLPTFKIFEKSFTGWALIIKGVEDAVLSVLFLVLLAPLLSLIVLLIKIESPGPVIFRQKRHGFNNEEFTVLKFRTMYHGRTEDSSVPQAQRDDPRVTRVGAFLRRTSFDELPQLFNVVRREMSLVGPRPHAVEHNKKYAKLINKYLGRHRVKPGITGWAQINGYRGETRTLEKMKMRVRYDLYYIENWSIWLDLKIIFITFFVILFDRNAY